MCVSSNRNIFLIFFTNSQCWCALEPREGAGSVSCLLYLIITAHRLFIFTRWQRGLEINSDHSADSTLAHFLFSACQAGRAGLLAPVREGLTYFAEDKSGLVRGQERASSQYLPKSKRVRGGKQVMVDQSDVCPGEID